jgi:hypothetical protein
MRQQRNDRYRNKDKKSAQDSGAGGSRIDIDQKEHPREAREQRQRHPLHIPSVSAVFDNLEHFGRPMHAPVLPTSYAR